MDTAIPVLIAIILLLLPFFYIAKAIFFFRENRQLNYRSVNIRALIYGLFGIIVIGLYFSIPSMIYKMEANTQIAHTGAYAGIDTRDTIVMDGFQMKHKYGDDPMKNYSSTYFLTKRINNKDIWTQVKDAFAYSVLGRKIYIERETLTLNYPIRVPANNTQTGKKNKKNQLRPPNDNANIINKYYLSLRSDTLILVPFNNYYSQSYRYLRFANYY